MTGSLFDWYHGIWEWKDEEQFIRFNSEVDLSQRGKSSYGKNQVKKEKQKDDERHRSGFPYGSWDFYVLYEQKIRGEET